MRTLGLATPFYLAAKTARMLKASAGVFISIVWVWLLCSMTLFLEGSLASRSTLHSVDPQGLTQSPMTMKVGSTRLPSTLLRSTDHMYRFISVTHALGRKSSSSAGIF